MIQILQWSNIHIQQTIWKEPQKSEVEKVNQSNELRKDSMKLRIKLGFQLVERTQYFPWDQ